MYVSGVMTTGTLGGSYCSILTREFNFRLHNYVPGYWNQVISDTHNVIPLDVVVGNGLSVFLDLSMATHESL